MDWEMVLDALTHNRLTKNLRQSR